MSASDFRVRFTAEGEAQVVNAMRKVVSESQKSGKAASRGFGQFNTALAGANSLLTQLAAAVSVGALVSIAKQGADAADQLGKMSQKVGASVTNLSALRLSAATADVSMEALTKSFVIFNRKSAELAGGGKDAIKLFNQLGIAAKDFEGKDAAERLDLVAQAFGSFKDSPEKTALAFQVFGKSAADLIPLLNDLSGDGGLQGAIDKARELGTLLSEDTAKAAQAINDDFTIIKEQVIAGAAKFVEGLAPAIHATLTDVQEDLGNNQDAWKEWGQKSGEFIALFVLTAEATFDRLGNALLKLGNTAAKVFQALRNPIAAGVAALELEAANSKLDAEFQKRQAARLQRAENVGGAITRGTAGLPKLRGGTQTEEPPVTPQGKTAAELEKDRLDAIEKLEEQRRRLIDKQLESEGKRHEVALRNIDEEAKKLDEVLRGLEAKGVPQPEREAQVAAFRASLTRAEDFKQQSEVSNAALNDLKREQDLIDQQIDQHLITQKEGNQKLLELESERLPKLREIAAALQAAAQKTNSADAIEAANEFSNSVATVNEGVKESDKLFSELGKTAKESFGDSIHGALSNAIREGQKFIDTLRDIGAQAADAIAQFLFLQLLKYAGFSAGGEVQTKAEGGVISGPGTGTSDSIPALLSNGEFVVRAAAVQQPGVLEALHLINRGASTPALAGPGRARRFADGGLVQGAGVGSLESTLRIGLARGLVLEEMRSTEGQRVIVQGAAKNPRSMRSALGG